MPQGLKRLLGVAAVVLSLMLSGCSTNDGFEPIGDNIFKKLNVIGDCSPAMKDAEHFIINTRISITRNIGIKTIEEFVIHYHNLKETSLKPWEDSVHWRVRQALLDMNCGDELTFKMPFYAFNKSFLCAYRDTNWNFNQSDNNFFAQSHEIAYVTVHLVQTFDTGEFANYLHSAAQQGELPETEAIELLLMNDTVRPYGKYGDCFIQTLSAGAGDTIRTGSEVTLSYTTFLLNGKALDKQTDLQFTFGRPDQVVDGLQYALSMMRCGDEAIVYLPSYLAFGEDGSTGGVVPPKTPVYFKLKVVDVKN
jgi:hypothetical protein